MASAFWNYEIEEELREQGWGNYCFHSVGDREKAMQKVDEKRAVTIYEHKHCSAECRRRGMRAINIIPDTLYLNIYIQVVENSTPLMAIGSYAIQYACIVSQRTFLGLGVH